MRRRLLLALAVVPLGAVVVTHGCSSETPYESLCAWVANPENCFREFREDMLTSPTGDCSFPGATAEVAGSDLGTPNGLFQARPAALCVINTGGSVTIDPPIDVTQWPPDPKTAPPTYTITFLDPSGTACGSALWTSPHGFSITTNAPLTAPTSADAGAISLPPAGADDDDGGTAYPYGMYVESTVPGRDSVDVTCPSGESHHFNLDEALGPTGVPTSACPGFAALVPEARLSVNPGSLTAAGGISFAIDYPPTTGPGASDNFPALSTLKNPASVQPTTVVYFNCTLPAATPTCQDTVKDGNETDIDCGGPSTDGCPSRCATGLGCLCDADCATGICVVQPKTGLRLCADPPATAAFPKCTWVNPVGSGPGTQQSDGGADSGSTPTTDAGGDAG